MFPPKSDYEGHRALCKSDLGFIVYGLACIEVGGGSSPIQFKLSATVNTQSAHARIRDSWDSLAVDEQSVYVEAALHTIHDEPGALGDLDPEDV